jgi:hypothetical protein
LSDFQTKKALYSGSINPVRQYVDSPFNQAMQSFVRSTGKIPVVGKQKFGGEMSLDQQRGLDDKTVSLDTEIAKLQERVSERYLTCTMDYHLKFSASLCGMHLLETGVCSVQRKTRSGEYTNSASTRSLPLMSTFTGGLSQKTAENIQRFLTEKMDEQVRTGRLNSIRLEKNSRGVPTLREETVNVDSMEITPNFLLLEAAIHFLNLIQSSAARIHYAEGKDVTTYDVSLCRGFLFAHYGVNWQTVLAKAWDGKSTNVHLPVFRPDAPLEIREFNLYHICEVIPLRSAKK